MAGRYFSGRLPANPLAAVPECLQLGAYSDTSTLVHDPTVGRSGAQSPGLDIFSSPEGAFMAQG
jgi:hypothetical protein